jgi:hypothetical protein
VLDRDGPPADTMGGGPCTHPARTDPAAVAARPIDGVAVPAGTSAAAALHLPCAAPDVPTAERPKGVIGDPAAHWGRATEWATRPSAPAAALRPRGNCAAVADPASSKPPAISDALHMVANTTPEPESTSQTVDACRRLGAPRCVAASPLTGSRAPVAPFAEAGIEAATGIDRRPTGEAGGAVGVTAAFFPGHFAGVRVPGPLSAEFGP